MRNLTKEDRLKSRDAQFTNLIDNGFARSTYKELDFFTKEDGKYFTLKVYRGTAANHELYMNYHTAERREQIISIYKQNFDRRQAYKAEQKAKNYTSSHAGASAAIKSELSKVFPNIKFSVRSDSFAGGNSVHIGWTDGVTIEQVEKISSKYQYGHFNGMEDIYEFTNRRDDIPQVKYVQENRTLSESIIKQVAEELKRVKHYTPEELNSYRDNPEQDARQILYTTDIPHNYTNLKVVHNDEQYSRNFYKIVFDVPQAAEVKETEIKEVQGKIQVVDYSEKAFAVIGDFTGHYDNLIALGGKYNKFLKCGKGIIYSKTKLDAVKNYLLSQKQNKTEQKEFLALPQSTTLQDEIKKTVEFFAEHDIKTTGSISESTKEIAEIQKVTLSTIQDETPQIYNNLQDIEQAAQSGKVISLYNLCQLVNSK